MIETNMDLLRGARKKAFSFSSTDGIGSVFQKSAYLLLELIKSNVDPEEIEFAVYSLGEERDLNQESDKIKNVPIRQHTYRLTEALERTMLWMIRKEIQRKELAENQIATVNEEVEVEDDLIAVSECRTSGKTVKIEDNADIDSSAGDECDSGGDYDDSEADSSTEGEHNSAVPKNGKSTKPWTKEKRRINDLKLKCEQCDRVFMRHSDMKRHIKFHMGEKKGAEMPYKCDVCGRGFAKSTTRYHHRMLHFASEESKRPYGCDECDRRFHKPETLEIHKRSHLPEFDHESKEYKCAECGKSYRDYYLYLAHQRGSHMDDGDDAKRPYKCNICGKSYITTSSLREHERITHEEDEGIKRPHICEQCGKRFSSRYDLGMHVRTHLADGEEKQPYQCDICGRRFAQTGSLRAHKKTHLGDDDEAKRPHQCQECGKRFVTLETLKVHRRIHLPVDDPSLAELKCNICDKVITAGRWALKQHKKTHLDDNDPEQAKIKRGFTCEVCGDAFPRERNLKFHMELHTKDKDERKCLECSTCGKRYAQRGHLNQHERTHAPEYDPDQAKMPCPTCGKKFSGPTALMIHQRTHLEGEENRRPFKCDECGKRFTQKTHLKVHIRNNHPGNQPREKFPCSICGIKYLTKQAWRSHQLTHREGPRPSFKCDDCGKCFKNRNYLKYHKGRHCSSQRAVTNATLNSSGERSGVSALSTDGEPSGDEDSGNEDKKERPTTSMDVARTAMKQTNATEPGGSKIPGLFRPFNCKLCPASFSTKVLLSEHSKSHQES